MARWAHGGEGWELAGLPEFDEVPEAGQQAGESGEDEGVQQGHDAAPRGVAGGLGADLGDEVRDVRGRERGGSS